MEEHKDSTPKEGEAPVVVSEKIEEPIVPPVIDTKDPEPEVKDKEKIYDDEEEKVLEGDST